MTSTNQKRNLQSLNSAIWMCFSRSILSAIFFLLQPSPLPSLPSPWDGLSFLFLWLIHLPWWHNPISKSLLLSLLQAPSESPCCKILLYVSPAFPQGDKLAFTSLIFRSLCYCNCSTSPFFLFYQVDWFSSSTAPDCPCPAFHDYQTALCY